MFVSTMKQIDGYGSQFQNIIAGIVYAELNNLEYGNINFLLSSHGWKKNSAINNASVWQMARGMNIDVPHLREKEASH